MLQRATPNFSKGRRRCEHSRDVGSQQGLKPTLRQLESGAGEPHVGGGVTWKLPLDSYLLGLRGVREQPRPSSCAVIR